MTKNDNLAGRPETPRDAALATVAAFRKDMGEAWGWERTEQLRDLEAQVVRARRLGVQLPDPEPADKARALGAKYSVAVDIEWDRGGGPSPYVIQLGEVGTNRGSAGTS